MRHRNAVLISGSILALAVLVTLPALATSRVVGNGIDLWITEGNGHTYSDFATEPIPAGFFCRHSEPFTGKIVFQGVPIVTGRPGALGRTDTIIQRLDDAAFNERGIANTRIQVRALTFQSVAPVQTSCGAFNVRVVLNGEQPITNMQIIRENERGGRFEAPIGVRTKLIFEPVSGRLDAPLEMLRAFDLPPSPEAVWSDRLNGNRRVEHRDVVNVDTNGDGKADTDLPGTTEFAAGWQTRGDQDVPTEVCHSHSGAHCTIAF